MRRARIKRTNRDTEQQHVACSSAPAERHRRPEGDAAVSYALAGRQAEWPTGLLLGSGSRGREGEVGWNGSRRWVRGRNRDASAV